MQLQDRVRRYPRGVRYPISYNIVIAKKKAMEWAGDIRGEFWEDSQIYTYIYIKDIYI